MTDTTTCAVGDTMVYPHHGPAVVEAVETREIQGVKHKMVVLRCLGSQDLKVTVRVDRLTELGVRKPVSKEDVDDLLEVLRRRDMRLPTNWSRRFKNHQEKLKTGDPYEVAEVVRNLEVRRRESGISNAERDMLAHARMTLTTELAISLGIDSDAAELIVDGAVA
jgi:CarD family transcriptional regulator